MQFKYGLDEKPPLRENLLFGLQWFAVTIPIIIVIGKITGGFHFTAIGDQMVYLQKLTFVMSIALIIQIIWGHRLPLVVGPSTILLVGIIASAGHNVDTIYTAIMCGGVVLSVLSMTGLLGHLKKLFSHRVVAVVLLLIAFTLAPTIMNMLITNSDAKGPLFHIIFSLLFIIALFFLHRRLSGIWRSTLIIWAMTAGTTLWFALDPGSLQISGYIHYASPFAGFFKNMTTTFSFEPGIMISFIICFMALFINDLGSIQSMNELLKPADTSGRITRGVMITGLSNIASGFLGVIGPVNFSLSPGVIAATGCASRFTMIPAAVLLFMLSFSPVVIALISNVPPIIIGIILIYIMSSQIAAGLMVACDSLEKFEFADGLIIGLPLLLATLIAFLPAAVLNTFPAVLRPIFGNGFVVGVTAAMILEHGIFRD